MRLQENNDQDPKKMTTTLDNATQKADSILNDPRQTNKLLDAAARIVSSGKYSFQISGITGKIKTLVRMVRCTARKEYLDVPWQTIILIIAALIYFVSPFDALADFLPLVGFVDDAAIISALFTSISRDVEKFIAWETTKTSSVAEIINSSEPE
ncbi:MAG: DUF1232 domain-containing protein [Chlorobiaceae bacterium]|nr:DUF1232 domain-containing protein [Chlorobiaceae bacterium]NTV16799.1 DUF1232 domain-containing protein [Chlorobiaceae bacterium]